MIAKLQNANKPVFAGSRRTDLPSLIVALLLVGLTLLPTQGLLQIPTVNDTAPHQPDFGKLPLSFEPNAGQTDPSVRFMAHASGGTLYFTPSEVVLALKGESGVGSRESEAGKVQPTHTPVVHHPSSIVHLQFMNANPSPEMEGGSTLPGKVNYFIGNDPSKWRSDLPTYAGVIYKDLYPGIDLYYEGTGGSLKGTYTVAPGADPSRIRWRYEGAEKVWVDKQGNLQVRLAGAGDGSEPVTVTEQAPVVWQEIGGEQVSVKVAYNLSPDNTAGFDPASYDHNYPLIIDPTLAYSTFLGGSGDDEAYAIALDSSGNAYVTGSTFSTNFPLQNPFQPILSGFVDVFVTKFNSTGSALIYSTYLGGSDYDEGSGIALDASGNAYVTGYTESTNFPLQDPFQPILGGVVDAFVTKFSSTGSTLVYSTFLGGTLHDYGNGIAVDASGNAYVIGYTASDNFPLQNSFQPIFGGGVVDAFVTKFSSTGSALVYSTFLGGSGSDHGNAIALDASGSAYVTGYTGSLDFPLQNPFQPNYFAAYDAFVTKFSPTGSTLLYSTYLGGTIFDFGNGIAVDASGSAYVTGVTESFDFPMLNSFQPTTRGYDEVFVTKFSSTGSTLVYSTFLGGSIHDRGYGVAVDASGNAYVTGSSSSTNFPLENPFQPFGGYLDAFVTKFSPTGSTLLYSTYLGGSGSDKGYGIAVDESGNAYVAGAAGSANFPLQDPYQPTYGGSGDAFVAKIVPLGTPPPTATRTATSSPCPTPRYRVLIIQADAFGGVNPTVLRNELLADPDVDVVDFFNAAQGTPTLAQLQAYDIVFTFSNNNYQDPTTLGNNLADYLDGGGIVFPSYYSYNTLGARSIQGRWLSGGYSPYNYTSAFQGNGVTLGNHDPQHPLMQGVSTLNAGARMSVIVAPDATQVAAYSDGSSALAVKGRAVGIPVYLGDLENRGTGHYARTIANAGRWLRPYGCPTSTPVVTASPSAIASTATVTRTAVPPTATRTATPVPTSTPTPTLTRTFPPPATPTFTSTLPRTATATSTHTYTLTPIPTSILTVTPTPTLCTMAFSDVQTTDYFYGAVQRLYCRGVISGYLDSTFRPYNNTTRAQLCKIIVLAMGWTIDTSGGPQFNDVPANHPFYGFVETAFHHNVISGYSDGSFRPYNNLTRGQLCKIIVLAMEWQIDTSDGPHFGDVPVTYPQYGFIETAYNRHIISGYTCGAGCLEFRPGNDATRGQICKIVYLAVISNP